MYVYRAPDSKRSLLLVLDNAGWLLNTQMTQDRKYWRHMVRYKRTSS